MADEYFFAMSLEGNNLTQAWDPEAKGASTDDYQGGHKLIIKQIVLGEDAVEGEVNVVQVEAMSLKESSKVPIAVLQTGGCRQQISVDLSFPDPPVTFSLLKGKGPVHLIGHHLIGGPIEEFDELDEMEEEMVDDEEGEEGAEDEDDEEPKLKKAKNNSNNSPKGKSPAKNNSSKPKK
ncbi:unnamed protein product [Ceutorhynchus assimilis]|uniref:Nucleoplasmin core domain-containing protein n=1 Tax=Ceutorhynchus assimilis TaxID=467358 RepID=A0A9N9MPY5_9CUCU|nr:unnamed protein product [Ceutorhynchus assimilis]